MTNKLPMSTVAPFTDLEKVDIVEVASRISRKTHPHWPMFVAAELTAAKYVDSIWLIRTYEDIGRGHVQLANGPVQIIAAGTEGEEKG